jgi:hypothetical protein
MTRISEWLIKLTNGWITLLSLVIFLLFTALVLPGQAANADAGQESVGSPDLSLTYSPEQLYNMAEAYGAEGRVAYIRARFSFDLIWPLVYTFFLTITLSWLFGRSFPPGSRWRLANLAPILGMLLDYLENLSTSLVMYRYPQPTDLAAYLAPVFTLLKWFSVSASFVLLLFGLAVAVWRWITAKRNG